ncbi:MAG: SH3 domain-containing protein [Lachnospiraceae bacterium]|nr:SH3 domain-containing protein [Lachnospiraceae bacterium]
MKIRGKQVLAALMSALMMVQLPGVSGFLKDNPGVAYADTYRQATVGATTLNVRSGPGTGNTIVKKLSHGAAVTVIGEAKDSAGTTWYKIRFTSGTETKEGYASAEYIQFPTSVSTDSDFEKYLKQQGFPDSYKDSLRTLHAEHPTWIFQAQKTGLDWNEVIENEAAVGANLVGNSSISSWKSTEYGAYDWNTGVWTGFDGASWVAASEEIVCYYMDPRNFLNDTYIFQFLNHNYDSAHQTKDGLQSMVKGTFLEKAVVSSGTVDQSAGPGAFSSDEDENYGPGSVKTPDTSGKNTNSTGPGASSSGQSTNSTGPGSTSPSQSTEGTSSGTQSGGVQFVSPSGTSQGNVTLEGPSAVVSAREMNVLAVPNVEYGPGMDASSITGDNTGASTTSPVPEGQSYTDIIMKAAAQSGVNPYVLCAMIIQEQGKGTSGSISGNTTGYKGYYNFFNVGAYQAGNMSAVTRGLWYASQSGSYGRPWNSIEKSIVGGSLYYGENYVKQGQDTFYLKKFNVQGSNLYKHQYMTNIEGAAGEGAKLARAYTDAMKSETLVFKIPVYNNMPETACAKPTGSGSPNNKLSGLTVTGYALTPTFNMNTESYDIIVNPSVERVEIKASVLDSKATVSGTGKVELQSGNNTIYVEVKAENGNVRTYKLNVVRQSNAPTVNVGPGTSVTPGSSVGPGAASTTSGSTNNGPGAASSGPGVSVPETTAPADTSVSVTRPEAPGGSQDVQVGVGPSGSSGSMTSNGTKAPSAITGVQTTVPQTQVSTEATVPQTQVPAETAPPETTAPSVQETAAAQSASLKKGDCNGDGSVTILDLMLINQQVLGQNVLSGAALKAADMNGDGKVTSADATAIQKAIFGQ